MPIRLERRAHVAEIVIDCPPVNALTSHDLSTMVDVLERAGRDPDIRVVLIRSGIERGFSAGVDVKEMTEGGNRAVIAVNRASAAAYAAVYDCPVPVIVAVHGYCLATGIGIVGNSDIVVASDDATFGLPEVDRGALGTTTQLHRLVPAHKVRWMMYSCERVTAHQLASWGSIERVVPRAELMQAADDIAEVIIKKSPLVVRRAKESLNMIDPVDVKRSFRAEQGFIYELNLTDVSDEARRAFVEKR